jgi:hypothetical protein
MDQPETKPSPRLRALLILGALVLLEIWGETLPSAVRAIHDPRGDAFELLPTAWATITALPLGVNALIGRISGREKDLRLTETRLIIAAGLAAVVVALEIFRRLMGGD